MEEIWKDIEGFPGYQVSNKSRVKSLGRERVKIYEGKYNGKEVIQNYKERILTPRLGNKGYLGVHLYNNGMKTFSLHRLVALAFIPNPSGERTINHIDGNKLNNDLSNLEWMSVKENLQHAHSNGLINHSIGEDHYISKLSEDDVRSIRKYSNEFKVSQKLLGKMYCVSAGSIQNIVERTTWKHI